MNEQNISKIGTNDILIASYPGAGSTWFGSIFVSLKIFYVEGYHERLIDAHSQKTLIVEKTRRQHLPTLHDRDVTQTKYEESHRVIKTHLLPEPFSEVFTKNPTQKVILLVRDGRDSVLSYYHWAKAFANYQGTLTNYLFDEATCPANDWAEYNQAWLKKISPEHIYTISFEKCRVNPIQELRKLLEFLCIERSIADIEYAINLSSYSNMKKLEDEKIQAKAEEIGSGKIMRKGKVNGWIDEFSEDDLKAFEGFPNKMLSFFGYEPQTIAAKSLKK